MICERWTKDLKKSCVLPNTPLMLNRSRPGQHSKMARERVLADLIGDYIANQDLTTHHFLPVGTFCFNSSNQFTTTLICAGCTVDFSIRNFWPSAVTS